MRATTCPLTTWSLKSTRISEMMPETCVPTATFVTGSSFPVLETTYSTQQSLDELGLEAAVGWLPARGQVLPFVAVAGGVRQEWIGSFRETRYPVGFDAGARLLLSPRVGLRGEYRFRRMLDDPVADFSEHRVLMGISVFWNNG